jgi:hypothetical protein
MFDRLTFLRSLLLLPFAALIGKARAESPPLAGPPARHTPGGAVHPNAKYKVGVDVFLVLG